MRVASAARLLATQAAWRAGVPSAGRALVRALDSPDPDLRDIAAVALVKAGRRSEPMLREAVERRQGLPTAISVLADVGSPGARAVIERFLADPDPAVAATAREALRVLAARYAGPPG